MRKVCLINVYFGTKWPDYFLYFLHSCKDNPSIDFMFFSNLALPFEVPNVTIVILNGLSGFNELASKKLEIKINVLEPYKLCDFKPAYGKIFEDFLDRYDFWGYCDIDLVFGDIRKFLNHGILQNYDVISAREEYPSGFFTLYRNKKDISTLFMLSKDFVEVFQSTRHYCFDECNFQFVELLINKRSISDVKTEIESMASVIEKAVLEKGLKYYKSTIVEEFLHGSNSTIRYEQGSLTDVRTGDEFLLTHLINLKRMYSFNISRYIGADTFYISNRGINSLPGYSLHGIINVNRRNLSKYQRYASWCIRYYFTIKRDSYLKFAYNHLDEKTYMVGNIKCFYKITRSNVLLTRIQTEDTVENERGKLLPISEQLHLYNINGKLFLFKFIVANSVPLKFEMTDLLADCVHTGYLMSSQNYSSSHTVRVKSTT